MAGGQHGQGELSVSVVSVEEAAHTTRAGALTALHSGRSIDLYADIVKSGEMGFLVWFSPLYCGEAWTLSVKGTTGA